MTSRNNKYRKIISIVSGINDIKIDFRNNALSSPYYATISKI